MRMKRQTMSLCECEATVEVMVNGFRVCLKCDLGYMMPPPHTICGYGICKQL
jgi:hypothetical protein